MLYHKADVSVEDKPASLIISRIESNVEAQIQISLKSLQKEINCLQRQECKEKSFLKKINLLWMLKLVFYNKDSKKIELEKLKKKVSLSKTGKGKNIKRINVTNLMKLFKKFKTFLIKESVIIKYLRNPIQDYPNLLFTRKRKYKRKIMN